MHGTNSLPGGTGELTGWRERVTPDRGPGPAARAGRVADRTGPNDAHRAWPTPGATTSLGDAAVIKILGDHNLWAASTYVTTRSRWMSRSDTPRSGIPRVTRRNRRWSVGGAAPPPPGGPRDPPHPNSSGKSFSRIRHDFGPPTAARGESP
ncbi:hypothetical protein GCM10009665_63630 [Kitasatospora nipponensis]|uniref:Uncharacterized protein n=1 Tax=Kitasatospora nipponensis TaxID=258049 RepID=A0ABN1WX96_9ACTN